MAARATLTAIRAVASFDRCRELRARDQIAGDRNEMANIVSLRWQQLDAPPLSAGSDHSFPERVSVPFKRTIYAASASIRDRQFRTTVRLALCR
ncbi:hypothetical protein BMG00_12620 [Thioclava marina]|uniref:Transposase n=1 Tax=Thioclava marina TaxID=1915077 RepID=A0ABX3MK28_9RHOB|nr:hypothetical protein BMG00_12620 [Thioclava marina]